MQLESELCVSVGQLSEKGRKQQNEDSIGFIRPEQPALTVKGMVAIVADGVSSAEAGKEASETCVKNFLSDYFSTPDSWTVKTSAQRILTALNRWLYGQGVNFHLAERGYISTLSILVIKSRTAHIFHIGDSRVHRFRKGELEQLTHDHSAKVNKDSTYLTRAMGMDLRLDVDYYQEDVQEGDLFFLSTDGVHDFVSFRELKESLATSFDDLQGGCERLVEMALANESDDNLSCQLICIDSLPDPNAEDAYVTLSELPFPPPLFEAMVVDDYRVISEIHASRRSQVYLVEDIETQRKCVMKTPSVNFEDDIAYKERFVMEPWIVGRIDSEHVVKLHQAQRCQSFLYVVYDYIEGQALSQWMQDNPKPGIDRVLSIVCQVVTGVRAMHRTETLHQDIKPKNIMIDANDHVTLIDFGACHVAGLAEIEIPFVRDSILGTDTYGAPEYKLGQRGSTKSELFSIAVVLYEMLTGLLPYGEQFERCQSVNDFSRLNYRPAREYNPMVPEWIDGAIQKALQISPALRYEALSEFIYDLKHPNQVFMNTSYVPISQRNPLRFWQGLSALFLVSQIVTLWAFLS